MTQRCEKHKEASIPFALAAVQIASYARPSSHPMQSPLFLDEGTPILIAGFMILAGAIVIFSLATYAAIWADVGRGIRTLACLVLWGISGIAGFSLCIMVSDGLVGAPLLVIMLLLLFGTCCYATYKLVTTHKAAPW